MNKKTFLFIGLLLLILGSTIVLGSIFKNTTAQNTADAAYIIYNKKGEIVSFEQMISKIEKVQVCLFGEFHNDRMSHWLELKILKNLHKKKVNQLVFGGEMWERDQQGITDECLKNKFYDLDQYEESTRLWNNFRADYKPLMKFCLEKDIPFVCTNVPRRYASMVSHKGDSVLTLLSKDAKSYLPPLPIAFNFSERAYKNFSEMLKSETMMAMKKSSLENLVKAQALKDATMAYWINKSLTKDNLFFHINGALHSAYHSGIVYYLNLQNPKLKIKTIGMVYSESPSKYKEIDSEADFLIVIPSEMGLFDE